MSQVKSRISPVRVFTGAAIGVVNTVLTGLTAWGVVAEDWDKVYFDLTLMACMLAWLTTIAVAHARHVERHSSKCHARLMKKFIDLDYHVRYGMVVAEAEQHLRAQGEH